MSAGGDITQGDRDLSAEVSRATTDILPRYVVLESTPGYMPDDDCPGAFATLRDARSYARDLVARLREFHEQGEDRYTVSCDSRTAPRQWYVVTNRPHDLGRVIEVVTIPEQDRASYVDGPGGY